MTVLTRPTPHPSVGSPTPSYRPGERLPADKIDALTAVVIIVFAVLIVAGIISLVGKLSDW